MTYRILGLSPEPFRSYFELGDQALKARDVIRLVAREPGLPCRVSLMHAAIGDELLLLNYEHQPTPTPYRSRHAIYVNRSSTRPFDAVGTIPEVIRTRLISVRAFDASHMMIDADVVDGNEAARLFEKLLANPQASYLHVHNARRGCYAARVERA